ncbi:hypothetical protein GF351_04285 [Candidatus Woesearchaeota archaeon]|nr:hypothetical protein [Candidatus Woesearchaeota archaeon]
MERKKMKKDALDLAARFSFMPNRLKFCGPDDIHSVLYEYICGRGSRKKASDFLSRFEALVPYLELIASKNSRKTFDYDVVEAYWIGNSLLEKVKPSDIRQMILRKFTKRGLPKETAKELAGNIPKGVNPHHSFHCLHIHTITGKIAPTLRNTDKCRISIGEVKKISGSSIMVNTVPLVMAGSVDYGEKTELKVHYNRDFLPDVRKRDKVALHWDFAAYRLSKKQAQNLDNYTRQNVEAMKSLD